MVATGVGGSLVATVGKEVLLADSSVGATTVDFEVVTEEREATAVTAARVVVAVTGSVVLVGMVGVMAVAELAEVTVVATAAGVPAADAAVQAAKGAEREVEVTAVVVLG